MNEPNFLVSLHICNFLLKTGILSTIITFKNFVYWLWERWSITGGRFEEGQKERENRAVERASKPSQGMLAAICRAIAELGSGRNGGWGVKTVQSSLTETLQLLPYFIKRALACYKFLTRFQGYEGSGSGFCHLSCCFYRGRESWISLVPHFTEALMVLFLWVGNGDPHIQMLWTALSNNVLPPPGAGNWKVHFWDTPAAHVQYGI